MHIIQKKILETLTYHEVVRFAALRPPKVESNLYSYHLKLLIKDGYVKKLDTGYTLAAKGLMYVDRVSAAKFELRQQPKIITILVLENKQGEILLWRRNKQPFINQWSLPSGKIHIDDPNITTAALREAHEKIGITEIELRHVGECYIKQHQDGEIISAILGHVFYGRLDSFSSHNTLWWGKGDKILPGTEEIIALAKKHKLQGRFFSEISTQ
jgi:ADP-ribose pyrophosphatase YjhB (NUDIX family)